MSRVRRRPVSRARLTLAAWLDRWEARVRRVGERVGWPQPWLREFNEYRHDRMSPEEFWVRYTLLRMETAPRFPAVQTDTDAIAFYAESEYPLWRNLVHRRHAVWRRVLWTMRPPRGTLLEYGCGTAPVSAYCARRKPAWDYWLYDLPSASLRYGCWRLGTENGPPQDGKWVGGPVDCLTLLDVLEHLPDPRPVAQDCAAMLRPGGYLHWNFVETDGTGLNRATPAQRRTTIAYLEDALTTVWERQGERVSRKC